MESMPKERGRRSWRNVKTYASLPSPVFWLQSSGFWLQSAVFCPSLRLLVSRFANDNDNKMLMAQIIVKQERKTETADCSLEFGVWSWELAVGKCRSWRPAVESRKLARKPRLRLRPRSFGPQARFVSSPTISAIYDSHKSSYTHIAIAMAIALASALASAWPQLQIQPLLQTAAYFLISRRTFSLVAQLPGCRFWCFVPWQMDGYAKL